MEGETVIAGVDTHKDVHVLCLLDGLGRKIWSGSFRADPEGYDRLAEAIGDPGSCAVVGVEGTASYGAGLTRRLVELGYNVVEVLRPKRDKARPGEGKSDPLDAERAARKAASGRGCSVPKSQDGWVEAVRQLYVARRLAVATSTSCVACAKSMLTTAPGALRERFRGRERPKDLMPLLARGRKAGDALEESVLASLRSRRGGLEGGPQPGRVLRRAHPRAAGGERARAARRRGLRHDDRRRPGRGRRRQPRQAEGRGGVLDAVRRLPDPRVEREDGAAQAQPRRQPAGELGALRDRDQAHGVRREDEEVRGEADLRGEVPAGGGPLPEALHSAGGVPRAHGPEPRRRRAGRPRAREDAQGDAGDPEAGRRRARPVRSHTRAPGTWETAVDETGEEVLRAPVRIEGSAPANCLLTTYRSVGFIFAIFPMVM